MCRVGCVLFIKPGHHTLHISELKYAPNTAHFQVFLEIYKTTGTYSLHIDDNLSQIQRETNAFLLLATHNTEIPPFADWQLRHKMFFFFVGLKNRVNLVLFFKPLVHTCIYMKCLQQTPVRTSFLSTNFDLL